MRHGGHGIDNSHDLLVENGGSGGTSAAPQCAWGTGHGVYLRAWRGMEHNVATEGTLRGMGVRRWIRESRGTR